MALVKVRDVRVQIPLYDMASRRLLRLPSFGRAAVGARTVTRSGSALNIHALSNLDLELHDGDRVCVIGHNGAGKTTLLRLIAGIYPPTTGIVEITGKCFRPAQQWPHSQPGCDWIRKHQAIRRNV
jgi:ABC-type polysaccharide/polyol phosphate transport system ATPase subunit